MEAGVTKPHFSIPSLIAIGAAIGSFFLGTIGGFILALVAIAFGILGFLLSMAPSIRGGLVSILAMLIGGIAIIVAVIRAITWAI